MRENVQVRCPRPFRTRRKSDAGIDAGIFLLVTQTNIGRPITCAVRDLNVHIEIPDSLISWRRPKTSPKKTHTAYPVRHTKNSKPSRKRQTFALVGLP